MTKLIFNILIYGLFLLLQAQTVVTNKVSDFINKESLIQKVEILASPEFAGRLPGHTGYDKASEYARKHFQELGLKPAFGNDYYQKLLVEYNETKPPASFCLIKDDKIFIEYNIGTDYAFRGFTGSGDLVAPVVFCGYGISTDGYDDYDNIDVTGKIAMVFKQNPTWKIDGVDFGFGYPREKAETAAEKGAVGLIMVSRPMDNNPQPVIGSVMDGSGMHNENFPQLQISLDAANDFLSGMDLYIEDLQSRIDLNKKPFSFELPVSALIKVKAEYHSKKETQNIAAILTGSDEKLSNEYIVIGAHLDHVGSQAEEVYYPGANDNASGSAAVIHIAEAFVKSGYQPKRSIIFTLFAAEEQGLKGAEYFTENPPVKLENIVAMINMDCIGSGDSIQIGNGKSAPDLWSIFRKIDSENDNLMMDRTWAGGGADATPFHNKGIPAAYVVSFYSYEHLHLPSDRPETLNQSLLKNIVQLTAESLVKIANGEYNRENLVE
jgi:aminopeptidase YwaD